MSLDGDQIVRLLDFQFVLVIASLYAHSRFLHRNTWHCS